MASLTYGFGINDSDYPVYKKVNGKQVRCKFYSVWVAMLERCYSEKHKERRPTYAGCEVSAMWIKFSSFKAWMEKQDWQGKQLDKDLLFVGNKIYSPETCVFIPSLVNNFILDCGSSKGNLPTGVSFDSRSSKLRASCCNPFTKKGEHLGLFTCSEEAREAWRKRKHELACQLADLQSDERVAAALRTRYANPL